MGEERFLSGKKTALNKQLLRLLYRQEIIPDARKPDVVY